MTFLPASKLIRSASAALVCAATACTSDGAGPGSSEVTLVLRRGTNSPTLSETGQASGARTFDPSVQATPVSCPFQAAAVTIDRIELQGDGGGTTLRSQPVAVELCDLGSQVLLLATDVDVPAGTYHEMRFVVSGGYVQTTDGMVYATPGYDLPDELEPADGTLQTPSWDASGLKVSFREPVTMDGALKVLALDVNVAQSFGAAAGGSGQWVMSPVISAVDISFTGTVRVVLTPASGVILPEIAGDPVTFADFQAVAIHGGRQFPQAFDPVRGEAVLFLSPHDTPYTLTLGVPAGLEVVATPASQPVTIHEGQRAPDVTFTLNSVTAPAGVANQPPSAAFSSPERPSFNATVGVPVQFNPTGTYDPEGAWGGTWDFGDGTTHTGTFGSVASVIVTHTYTAPGNYTVTWTAVDEQGATSVATTTAVVSDP